MKASRCGKCGNYSESHELMQLNTPLPWSSFIKPIHSDVPGTRDDIQSVRSLSKLSLDEELEKIGQVEEVLA